jgi:hypothetical protein
MQRYCHMFQWLSRGFGLVNRFIGSSLVVTTITSYTIRITVTIPHVRSHIKSSNSSSGHTAVLLDLRNSSTQNTPHYCCMELTTLKASHVIATSPVHWRADCWVATSYKYSSSCCVTLSEKVFIAPLPSYARYGIIYEKWCWGVLLKRVYELQFRFKSDKNNGYLTRSWREFLRPSRA